MKNTTTICAAIGALAIIAGTMGARTRVDRPPPRQRGWAAVAVKPVAARARVPGLGGREIDCIASAVWHEARNQPRAGQIAVAEVVMRRRATGGRFPRNACGVILQRRQFSFIRHGVVPRVPARNRDDMRAIARGVIDGTLRSPVRGAMFFHATYVSPDWDRSRLGRLGDHVFYR